MRYRTRVSYKARHLITQETPLSYHFLLAKMKSFILFFVTIKIVFGTFFINLFNSFSASYYLCR